MVHLSQQSLSAPASKLVASCIEHQDIAILRRESLKALTDLVGADEAYFVSYDHSFPFNAPEYIRRFGSSLKYLEELAPAIAAAQDSGAYIDTEVYAPSVRRKLSLFREVVPPEVRSQVVVSVSFGGRSSGLIHLNRCGVRGSNYRPRDIERVRGLLKTIGALHTALIGPPPRILDSDHPQASRLERLTPRQLEIARSVAQGLTSPEIATNLQLSPRTVRNHLSSIFERCDVASRAELAALVTQAGYERENDHLIRARQILSAIPA